MLLQGTVGPTQASDGAIPAAGVRLGRLGEGVVTELHGKYYEQSARGNVFTAVQANAGVILNTLGTTASFALLNPPGSGKNMSLLRIGFVLKVLPATPVIGYYGLYINSGVLTQTLTGTILIPFAAPFVGGNNPVVHPYTTATLPATPSLLEPMWQKTTTAEAPTTPPAPFVAENLDGRIVIGPGNCLSLMQDAADATNGTAVVFATWEEVPI